MLKLEKVGRFILTLQLIHPPSFRKGIVPTGPIGGDFFNVIFERTIHNDIISTTVFEF